MPSSDFSAFTSSLRCLPEQCKCAAGVAVLRKGLRFQQACAELISKTPAKKRKAGGRYNVKYNGKTAGETPALRRRPPENEKQAAATTSNTTAKQPARRRRYEVASRRHLLSRMPRPDCLYSYRNA